LAPIGHEAAIETGTTIEHHAAIDAAAALHSDLDHLLPALATVAPLDTSPLTAAASARSHCQIAPYEQGNEQPTQGLRRSSARAMPYGRTAR
jgi:hypothetical protein